MEGRLRQLHARLGVRVHNNTTDGVPGESPLAESRYVKPTNVDPVSLLAVLEWLS